MRLLFGAAIGAALTYFMDPDKGESRRQTALGHLQRGKEQAASAVSSASGSEESGDRAAAEERLNDPALARKVESEIFRDDDVPKGDVVVNVENGKVFLRGEVSDGELVTRLGDLASQVDGISGVENLLHAPGVPAPAKTS